VLIELFLAVTAEALRANIDWKLTFFQTGSVFLVQNFRQKGLLHQPFFLSEN